MERVLIIEDDELIAELGRDYLEANGYETALAFDGITGEQKAKTEKYDAILLDVMLPGKTGFDVCRELRKSLRLPIIMVTAKKEDIDKIRGLGLGADDYLVKLFSPTELVARVKSHIYIHNLLSATEEEEQQETEITYRNLTILPKSRRVYLDKKEVVLVNKERISSLRRYGEQDTSFGLTETKRKGEVVLLVRNLQNFTRILHKLSFRFYMNRIPFAIRKFFRGIIVKWIFSDC